MTSKYPYFGDLPFDPARLPPDERLTFNQVARQCGLEREDVKTMVGCIEKRAGKLPSQADNQGQVQRFIPATLLLPYFEMAAVVMRAEQLPASQAMNKVMDIGLPRYLEKLEILLEHLTPLVRLPRELESAAFKLDRAAKTPQVHQIEIRDCEAVSYLLDELSVQLQRWQIGAGVLAFLWCVTTMILVFFAL